MEKIKMQGAIQKWIDNSISITYNLPENTTEAEVSNIYMEGWKAGCKGLTIYREGSRSGVLLSTKKEETCVDFNEHNAPKRPRVLPADYYYAKADGKEFAVIIGTWPETNKPYEVFAFENPPMNKNTKGKIIKLKKGHYKFINGEFEIDQVQLAAERVEERTLTLTASMLLRHGAPVKHVVNIIKKIDENITSFSSAIRRYLSRYIPDEEVSGEVCPKCGEKLIRSSGCIHCLNEHCGFSKCN
jgi:ribonucleoside-diphosphate reductase alpha chain